MSIRKKRHAIWKKSFITFTFSEDAALKAAARVEKKYGLENYILSEASLKRDMDLIRALLLKLEAEATDRGFSFEEGEAETLKRTLDEVRYNLQQAEQMGLIEVGSKPLNGEWKILRLTPKGHDFLERGQNTERPLMNALKEPERFQCLFF